MATIRLLMLSGRPDPIHTLSGTEADELLRTLAGARALISMAEPFPLLGFRGLEVQLTDEEAAKTGLPSRFFVANGQTADEEGGMALVRSVAAKHFGLDLGELLEHFRAAKKNMTGIQQGSPSLVPGVTPVLAVYNPEKYNNNPAPLANNNCYAYGCDRPTNTFPQPGRAHGYELTVSTLSGPTVESYSIIDGLVNAAGTPLLAGGPVYYVALVFAPRWLDYHWYRQVQTNGNRSWPATFWGHKPGQTAVTNLDSSGNVITNPETCDRGPYTQFIGYLYVPQSVVDIA